MDAHLAHALQQPDGSQGDGVGAVLGNFKAHHHVTLSAQMIDLIRPNGAQQPSQRAAVSEIAAQKFKAVRRAALEKMIDAPGVEAAGAPDQAEDPVVFLQEQLSKIRAVLPGQPGNERCTHHGSLL